MSGKFNKFLRENEVLLVHLYQYLRDHYYPEIQYMDFVSFVFENA